MVQSHVSAQKSVRLIIGLAIALGFAVIGMVWAAVEMDIRQERTFAQRTASQSAQNYARLFDEHIRRAVDLPRWPAWYNHNRPQAGLARRSPAQALAGTT
jgi:hypothetical protein